MKKAYNDAFFSNQFRKIPILERNTKNEGINDISGTHPSSKFVSPCLRSIKHPPPPPPPRKQKIYNQSGHEK